MSTSHIARGTLIDAKRVRRELEPENKTWGDAAVDLPWEDLQPRMPGEKRRDDDDDDDNTTQEATPATAAVVSPHETLRYGGRRVNAQTTFVLKNVFFFSHATPVQSRAVPLLRTPGTSAIVEAPTGSGKTLAFLVPMVERLVYASHSLVVAAGRPNLTRSIVGIVLSPSRVLAEQTAVVARKLCSRYPFAVSTVLCDGVCVRPEAALTHIQRQKRGGGTILISTPGDLWDLLEAADKHAEDLPTEGNGDGDEADEAANGASPGGKRQRGEDTAASRSAAGPLLGTLLHCPAAMPLAPAATAAAAATPASNAVVSMPFQLVVDEADVVLRAPKMRSQVEALVGRLQTMHAQQQDEQQKIKLIAATATPTPVAAAEPSTPSPAKKGKKAAATPRKTAAQKKKEAAEEAAAAAAAAAEAEAAAKVVPLPAVDLGFFGATAGTSEDVIAFAKQYTVAPADAGAATPVAAAPVEEEVPSTPAKGKGGKATPKGKGKAAAKKEAEVVVEPVVPQPPQGPARSVLHSVVMQSTEDYASLLDNRVVLTAAEEYLHTLIHLINLHPNRKHFVFFTNASVLLFVKAVLERVAVDVDDAAGASSASVSGHSSSANKKHLSEKERKDKHRALFGDRGPGAAHRHYTDSHVRAASSSGSGSGRRILFVPHIYAMHEHLSEGQKFGQYNGFLGHGAQAGGASAATGGFVSAKLIVHKRDRQVAGERGPAGWVPNAGTAAARLEAAGDTKNPHFMGGWKRDGRPPAGTGAILLCTDEAAFGLDVRDVDYVYHAEVPSSARSYVHRVGRVGRMGMRGTSVLLLPVMAATQTAPEAASATMTATGTVRSVRNSRGVVATLAAATAVVPAQQQPPQQGADGAAAAPVDELAVLASAMSPEQKAFFQALNALRPLEAYKLAPGAPLSGALRATVRGDAAVAALGRKAAMSVCGFGSRSQQHSHQPSESGSVARDGDGVGDEKDAEEKAASSVEAAPFSWFTPKIALAAFLIQ